MLICYIRSLFNIFNMLTECFADGTSFALYRINLHWMYYRKEMMMKNIALTLMSAIVSLLLVRYYPYISKKILVEYIAAACLSLSPASRSGKLINSDDADWAMNKK